MKYFMTFLKIFHKNVFSYNFKILLWHLTFGKEIVSLAEYPDFGFKIVGITLLFSITRIKRFGIGYFRFTGRRSRWCFMLASPSTWRARWTWRPRTRSYRRALASTYRAWLWSASTADCTATPKSTFRASGRWHGHWPPRRPPRPRPQPHLRPSITTRHPTT